MLILSTRSAATPPTNPAETEINGRFGSISKTFDNGDTQTIIAKLFDGRAIRGTVDNPDELQAGGYYLFVGHWNEHPKYGWQFAFSGFATDIPRDADGSAAYLMRHCTGIGMTTANRLVEKYGGDAVRIVSEEPQRAVEDGLLRLPIALAAAQALREVCDPSLAEAHLELFRLLRSGGGGFPRGLINKCLKLWNKAAPERIRRDPFTLLVRELPGCGFLRCDRLYTSLGHPPDRLKRQMLAVWYELRQRGDDTWVSLDKALQAVRDRIGGTTARPKRAVALGYRCGWLDYRSDERGGHWIAERGKARAEQIVAQRVHLLCEAGPPAWPKGPFAGLSEHQQQQIDVALQGMIAILTGSPGTGKTFSAAAIIRAIADTRGLGGVAVCAPTGKAAVRISETMRAAGLPVDATTIHKLLGVRGGGGGDGDGWKFAFNENTPLPYRYVIVDELSMLDTSLAASLLRACAPGTHLLLVGDVHQLPPVGHGAPLRDLLDAGIPAARLTEIRRNAGLIVEGCARIKDGKPFEPIYRLSEWNAQKNLVHLPARGTDAMRDTLLAVYDWLASQHRWGIIDQVQVLAARNPTRKRLNKELQDRLNKDGEGNHPVFKIGDKVINIKNGLFPSTVPSRPREYVANGDMGRIYAFHGNQMAVRLSSPDRRVLVPLGRVKEASGDEATEEEKTNTGCTWDLAFCCTVHKSQGSEWPVVIALVEPAGPLASRELIYTAISRARELCVLIGSEADIHRHVRNSILPARKTFLADLLREHKP
jgi:exodeoxyribonuclease V alpha subunit